MRELAIVALMCIVAVLVTSASAVVTNRVALSRHNKTVKEMEMQREGFERMLAERDQK